ncbi:hypothetical protein FACS189446_1140 [Bacteroidia bacterium]|nr:hypothetical protein FACS189446_1140 [Bacteroidia bacterium]
MNISELSIKRPVLSTVFVLVITLFGFIGYSYLGIREYPSVDNPIITVDVSYPGANADIIENQITEPLEQNINGIPGIRSLSSTSSQGSSRITVEFELSVDMETAANDVRDKVSRAQRFLPRDCDPPTVSKADADDQPILQISIQSEKRNLLELSEIADLTVKERLQTIQNVSAVSIWGEKRYAMRLWLDPVKMAAYSITPVDIRNAIDRENVELPSGSIEGDKMQFTIRTMGLMKTPEEFNNLVIRETANNVIRLRDVGYAELGPEDQRSIMRKNGVPMVSVVVIPQPGANHIEISDEVKVRVAQMQKDLPEDVRLDVVYDNTKFIRASIKEVQETIYIAFILVVVIIFLFLRDWRATLVPVIVIPVSLVGAFFIMYVAGFSINVLSMLAVVLAVGLVVDDAIVMAENIYVRIEQGISPKEAGIEGSKEIFFAIVSTTITLVAVFFPIVFMQGMTGRLFKEFSIVVSGAVAISAFVALTFTPMLSTKILRKRETKNILYEKTEPFFEGMNRIYEKGLAYFLAHRWLTWPIVGVTLIIIVVLMGQIKSEMAPLEDRSQVRINMTAPEGSTYEFYRDYAGKIAAIADSVVPEKISDVMLVRSNFAFIQLMLPDIKDRERSQMAIADAVSTAVRKETEARAFVQQQSTFGGRRGGMPVQYVLQAPNLEKLQEFIPRFMAKVSENPKFQMSDVNLKFTKPETRIEINRDKAALLGVSTRDIGQTLQYALSGQRMGYFYMNGKQYQILAEINRQQRNKPLDLKSMYVKNASGGMIQLDNLVDLSESVSPPQLYRYNRFNSATVSSGLAPGVTIGEGLNEMDKIAKETLDESFRTALAGESKEFRESSSSLMFTFSLALVLIFLILAAQFESFKDPLIIMLTVPLAVAGALIFMYFGGITMNIFSQIGIIMLIGLVAKNGILIVEFANQRQETGMSKLEAIEGAAIQRLRPILMTSLCTVLGLLPLAFASAEGANSRVAMGVSVIGGMIVSTFLTLFIVPAVYTYFSTNRTREVKGERQKAKGTSPILYLLPFAFCLLPSNLHSQEVYDLKRCLETGLEKNYDLRIVHNEQQISDNNLTWGNAGFLPALDLSAGYSGALNNNTVQKYTDGSTVKNENVVNQGANLGLNVSWTVFDGLYMQTNYQRLKEFQKMGELNTKVAIENLISDIASEYYNFVYQNLRLGNLKYVVSLSKERLRIVEARYNIGSMSRLDLQQARVDFNADSSNLIKQFEIVNTSRIMLNRLMALEDVSQQIVVKDTLIDPNPDLKEKELRSNMEQSNARILLSAKNRMIGELDYKALKSRNYPYLKVNAGYGYALNLYGSGTLDRQDNLGLTYGLTLGFNIFDGFNRRREQKNAKLTIQNRQLQYEQMGLSLKADLANIWMAYKNNFKLINLEKENLETAHENYEIAMERYRLGELSGIELREAQNSLLGAEERLLQAQYNTKLCEISLMQISGQATSYLE